MYGLSYAEMMAEPADKFLLNLFIESLIKDKERREAKYGANHN